MEKTGPSTSRYKRGNGVPGTWRLGFEETQATFYEPGTKLDTLKYIKSNHLCNKTEQFLLYVGCPKVVTLLVFFSMTW